MVLANCPYLYNKPEKYRQKFQECLFVAVNLSGVDRVNMSHFDLLKVLGTGGELNLNYYLVKSAENMFTDNQILCHEKYFELFVSKSFCIKITKMSKQFPVIPT